MWRFLYLQTTSAYYILCHKVYDCQCWGGVVFGQDLSFGVRLGLVKILTYGKV